LQDQVASSVAGAIEPKLRQSEIERASRKPAANLTAYDLYLRALAQSYRYSEEGFAEAVVLARQALAIDPSYAPAAALVGRCRGHARGLIHASCNQPEAAIEAIERARRLSPFDPLALFYALHTAIAHLAARRFEQAIEWADRALHDQPRTVPAMRVKVAASAHLGRLDEARAELSRMLVIDPKLTIAGFRAYARFLAPEVLELYVTGLRLAGLPEE
jgi:adenylate cyclase